MQEKFENETSLELSEEILAQDLTMMGAPLDKLHETESLGGNAGFEVIDGKKYSCRGLNGYADPASGKIIAFGNYQDINRELIKGSLQFTFREAFNLSGLIRGDANGKLRKIVSVHGLEYFTEDGRRIIFETIHRYNRLHWAENTSE